MKFSSVTKEERSIYEQALERKRMNFYFDNVTEVTSIGYRILQQKKGEGTDSVIPILLAETGKAIREMFPDSPEEGILVVGVLRGLAPQDLKAIRGDILEALDGVPIRNEKDLGKFMKENPDKEKIRASFSRHGNSWEEELPVVRAAKKIRFLVDGKTSEVAAYTDGKEIVAVSTQMLRFAAGEEELTFIIAHELGHVLEGHRLKTFTEKPAPVTAAASLGALLDQLAPGPGSSAGSLIQGLAQAPYSQKMELAADVYAARRMKELGFDPAAAGRFIKRFAVELPATQKKHMLSSHPTSSERMAALEQFAGKP